MTRPPFVLAQDQYGASEASGRVASGPSRSIHHDRSSKAKTDQTPQKWPM